MNNIINDLKEIINNLPDSSDNELEKKNKLQISKYKLFNVIEKINEQIKITEKQIYKICDHEWKRESSSYDEKTTYICNKCGLYDDKYIYN